MSYAEIPIVDAHHHVWKRKNLPWLWADPPLPHRYGTDDKIRRDYDPEDYLQDTRNFRIVGTVFIEAMWDDEDPIGETRWIHGIAEQFGFPNAVVAQAWLNRGDAEEVLATQASFPLVKGVRHKPTAAPRPADVKIGAPGSMSDPLWRKGFALLDRYDLSFDLQVEWWHLFEAADLARDFPRTKIFLDHTGLPADRSAEGLKGWRKALEAFAASSDNVVIKISGIGLPFQPWRIEDNAPVVRDAISIFGVERCMFASNYPVDGITASFDQIMGGYLTITRELPTVQRDALFRANAIRHYRMRDCEVPIGKR